MEKIDIRLADKSDNKGILSLLDHLPMGHLVKIIYKRNPDYFYGTEIQGYQHQILIATKNNDEIIAIGARHLKEVYINGKKKNIGYLSDLRINSDGTKHYILANGYKYMHSLMNDNQGYLHLTTIIEDNRSAKAALTWENKHKNIPNYYSLGRINTYCIIPLLFKRTPNDYVISRGSLQNLPDIVDFLNKEGRNKQFYPVYTAQYFLNLRDFKIEDFCIAYKNNKIVGVLAKWNQAGFKQLFLQKYSGIMKWIYFLFHRFLPKENSNINYSYIAFMAFKDNNPKIFKNLLIYAYNNLRQQNEKYFLIGMFKDDPLNQALNGFIKFTYKSRLYIAEYKSDKEIKNLIDNRLPYVEVATL